MQPCEQRDNITDIKKTLEKVSTSDNSKGERLASIETKVDGLGAKLDGVIEKMDSVIDKKADKSTVDTLEGRIWAVVLLVIAAIVGAIFKVL